MVLIQWLLKFNNIEIILEQWLSSFTKKTCKKTVRISNAPEVLGRPPEDSRCSRDYIWAERYDERAAVAGGESADRCSAAVVAAAAAVLEMTTTGWPAGCWVDGSAELGGYYYSKCCYCYFCYCCSEGSSLHRLLALCLWYLRKKWGRRWLVMVEWSNGHLGGWTGG